MRRLALAIATVLMAGGGVPSPASAAKPASAGSSHAEATGALYGTIYTDAGRKYTGVLRWDDEEAFWDDLFNSGKENLPYIDRLPDSARSHRGISILGVRIDYDWNEGDTGRQFISRFGDIKEIQPRHGDDVDVVMKSGTTYRVDGGSNDIGTEIQVEDADAGTVTIKWRSIEKIVFAAAPASARLDVHRLFGEVATEDGVFRGFVQWDSQECLSTDLLDGHTDEGKVSLRMGAIRSIEKESRKGAEVALRDGRTMSLRGTNDIDSSIRGIFVEDERFGRVKISWDAFQRVDFREGAETGRSYADYKPATSLRGTVTDNDGGTWKGRIIFDLDESETWELLNGDRHGIEYSIPFRMVRTISPHDSGSSDVTLRNGQKVRLEESQDVTESNAGVLVILDGGDERYVPWEEVRQIEFE